MSHHDVVTLDANFRNWQRDRAAGLGKIEPFLYYAVDQITKRFNMTDEQLLYGITDHPNDGGVDSIYCLTGKGNILLRDDIQAPICSDSMRVLIFQVKSSLSQTGFSPDDIDRLANFTDDLLHLEKSSRELAHKYQPRLLTIMQVFKDRYLEMAGRSFPRVVFEYYYVTRGDEEQVSKTTQDAIDRLKQVVVKHRGARDQDNFVFNPVDTQALYEYVRKRRQRTRSLKWNCQPIPVGDGYVGLVKLPDYFKFLKDESGSLDELIFESNVRGNQGKTSVNEQMRKALESGGPPDFWQLNNGITITCSALEPVDAWNIRALDAQLVNGLQTSRQVFGYLSNADDGALAKEERSVLIKLMAVSDDAVRDRVIRATDNQNPIKASALRATDALHRDIEDLFKRYDLYYDRRPGFYKDQGKPIGSIVSLVEVVQSIVTLVLHRPDDARARPGDYIKEGKRGDEKYRLAFGSQRTTHIPLGAYLKCVRIIRTVKDFLQQLDDLSSREVHNLVFYVAYYTACDLAQSPDPSADELLKIDSGEMQSTSRLTEGLKIVRNLYDSLVDKEDADNVAKGKDLLAGLRVKLIEAHGRPAAIETKPKRAGRMRPKDVLRETEVK